MVGVNELGRWSVNLQIKIGNLKNQIGSKLI
jgi:hypothetical protein